MPSQYYNTMVPFPPFSYNTLYEVLAEVGEVPNVRTEFVGYRVVTETVQDPGIDMIKYRNKETAGPTPGFQNMLPHDRPVNGASDDQQWTVSSIERVLTKAYGYNGEYTKEDIPRYGSFAAARIASDPEPQLRNMCEAKFFTKLNNVDFNAGTFAAESKSTSKLILQTAKRLSLCLKDLRKLQVASAMKHLGVKVSPSLNAKSRLLRDVRSTKARNYRLNSKELSSLWLEAQYGWGPLVSDVENAAKFAAKRVVDPDRTEWTHLSAMMFKGKTHVHQTEDARPTTTRATVKQTVKCGCWVRYTRAAPQAVHDLGLTDLSSTAWELVPYSFVFDWFVNINEMLTAANALSSYQLSGGYVSSLLTSECIGTVGSLPPRTYGGQTTYTYTLRNPTWRRRLYTRIPWTPSVPEFRFHSDPLGLKRATSALALIRQKL